jgi:hypothetical protein
MRKKSSITMQRLRRIGITLAFGAACSLAAAQEIPTRTQSASLQAFGLFSYVEPHYDSATNMGGSFGADLNLRPLYLLQPSLELRATFAPGADASETTYNFGPRLEVDLGRLRPYVTLMIGTGSINFTHPIVYPTGPYAHDSSIVYSGTVGADYMITRQVALRGDVMLQSWNLGNSPSTAVIFHPQIYSFGVDYRFDFNLIRHKNH